MQHDLGPLGGLADDVDDSVQKLAALGIRGVGKRRRALQNLTCDHLRPAEGRTLSRKIERLAPLLDRFLRHPPGHNHQQMRLTSSANFEKIRCFSSSEGTPRVHDNGFWMNR